jgi:hypothetical protein
MLALGLTFAIDALILQWISMIFLYLERHFLLAASRLGCWTGKSCSEKADGVLNDSHLSAAEHMQPYQLSITEAPFEIGQIVSPSKRFMPISAPARGSIAPSL